MTIRLVICLFLLANCLGTIHAECVQGLSHVITRPNDLTRTRLVGSIYFCPDETKLDSGDEAELQYLQEYMGRLDTDLVVFAFVGFADITQGKINNDHLAHRRAEAVKQYVENHVYKDQCRLAGHPNYRSIRAFGWGDIYSDLEQHLGWRRVDIFTKVLEYGKEIGTQEAIDRSREVLGSIPGEAEDRLRCLLDKISYSEVSDLYFLKTYLLDASKGGISPNRFPDLSLIHI